MDTSDTDITFDENGVCNYCLFADSKANERRAQKLELPWVIRAIKDKGKGKKYDCLIGLSGGVDSSYALHKIVEQGLRPLCFSVDNGWQTPQADENIMRLVEGLKVPFYRYTINLERFRELQRAFIMSGVKNIEIPTDHVLMATTYEMAHKYKIKTIISGGNWQTEGTMPPSYGYNASDLTHIKAIYMKFTGKYLDGLPTISLLKYLWRRNVEGIKVVNILDYYDYNREDAIRTLVENYGYKPYGEKHGESKFTEWFQNSYLILNFNIDKRKPHLSSMIHSGQMTKEEAMKIISKPPISRIGKREIEKLLGNLPSYRTVIHNDFHEYSDYLTNEKWVKRWQKFFNILKKYGYNR